MLFVTTNEETEFRRRFSFIQITPGRMLVRWPAGQSTSWTWIWCNIRYTGDAWRLRISIFLLTCNHHLDTVIFNSNEEVINEIDQFLDSRKPQFFAEGIQKITKLWQAILNLNEDYCIHQCCLFRVLLTFYNRKFFGRKKLLRRSSLILSVNAMTTNR